MNDNKRIVNKLKLQKYKPLLDALKECEGFELSEEDIDDWLTCVLDDKEIEYREHGLQNISYSNLYMDICMNIQWMKLIKIIGNVI